jgi:hypothetical protein
VMVMPQHRCARRPYAGRRHPAVEQAVAAVQAAKYDVAPSDCLRSDWLSLRRSLSLRQLDPT